MDLQDDSALETMSASSPASAATVQPVAAAASAVPARTTALKGFPKQIAQNVIEDKFLCEHCKLILRHPMQSTCGHRFCRPCRDELLSLEQPVRCQACLTEGASEEESQLDLNSMFDDKAAIREMKKILVKCINQGCQWKGTFLEYSESHELNCDKKLVECSLCGVPVSQARIQQHETKQCPKRTVPCPHCKETMLAEQLEKHVQANCPNLPVKCDKCAKQLPRSEMKTHRDEECPHRIVECPVPDCNSKLPLDQFPNHFMKTQQSTQKHILYLFNKIAELEKTITQLERETGGVVAGAAGGLEYSHHGGTSGGDVAGAEANVLSTEDRQKLKLHEDLMAVLHGEILRCIKHVESLTFRLEKDGKTVKDAQKKIDNLEKSFGDLEKKLQEVITRHTLPDPRQVAVSSSDPREYGILTESPDGTATWRIDKFTQVRRAACNGQQPFISSPSFITGPCGYKLKVRFFADGDGSAKGKAFSAFIQLQKGPYDDLLPWPFAGKVFFMIVDLKDFNQHKVVSFNALPGQPEFEKPQDDNPATGCLTFVNLKDFSEGLDKYLVNDTIFLKIHVSVSENINTKLQSMDLKRLVSARR